LTKIKTIFFFKIKKRENPNNKKRLKLKNVNKINVFSYFDFFLKKTNNEKGATVVQWWSGGTPVAVAANGVGHAGPHFAHSRRRVGRGCQVKTRGGETSAFLLRPTT
jgi:hypothetical protein